MRKAEQKASSKKKLSELKCTEWWYQWLSQALLIKAGRSVVLARLTRVPARGHYDESTNFRAFEAFEASERSVLLTRTTTGQGSDKSTERGMGRRGSRPA